MHTVALNDNARGLLGALGLFLPQAGLPTSKAAQTIVARYGRSALRSCDQVRTATGSYWVPGLDALKVTVQFWRQQIAFAAL